VVSKGKPEEKLSYLFGVYDSDKSGTLDKNELSVIIERMRATSVALGTDVDKSKNFIEGIMTKLDAEKKGHITKKVRSAIIFYSFKILILNIVC
jgi:diacylglycerol kinase (ATP)